MKNLEVLTTENAPEESKPLFNAIKSKVGMVPNVYAAIGNSAKALGGFLSLSEALSGGVFSGKEVEAISLSVAQVNDCNYCLAAHTAIGKMKGFSEEQTVEIRTGEIQDTKLKALTDLAKSITVNRGKPDQELIDTFFNVGYKSAALAELITLVALNSITNYTNLISGLEIDFPVAPELEHA